MTKKTCLWVALCGAAFASEGGEGMRRLSLADYRDRMAAGWIGQMVGVEWGLPTEFKFRRIIPDDKVPDWTPKMVNGAYDNDDLFVEMTFLKTLDRCGLFASPRQAGIDFANSRFGLCAANWVGRDNLRRGIAPPESGHASVNPCADDIDYQIESDYAGLVSPGLPQNAIRLGDVFGRMVNDGDGVWAGQFMGGLYAEAFFTDDIDRLLDAGLACIPAESHYAQMVRDVRVWHRENPGDWSATWAKIKARYIDDPAYQRGRIDQRGSDVKPNGAFVVAGLLYGGGDLRKSMRLAMRGGWDSDCNPSSVGGVLATAKGLAALRAAFDIDLDRTRKFKYGDYRLDDVFALCERLARAAVVAAGGRIVRDAQGAEWFEIPVVSPTPAPFAPSWAPAPASCARFTDDERRRIVEPPFPGIAQLVRQSVASDPPPIGLLSDGEADRRKRIFLTNAPFELDREELPIRITGLTNTIIHLAWGKYHTLRPRTLFVFDRCDNVSLRHGTFWFDEPVGPDAPSLVETNDCRACTFEHLQLRGRGKWLE